MTNSIGKTKVAVVFTLLLAIIVLGQITPNSGIITSTFQVVDFGKISQTYTDHAAISVNGNADFLFQASIESWDGIGSVEDPIIIEGYKITDSIAIGIQILNVNLHWILKDCLIDGSPPYACGIDIQNCSNGEISNNIIQNRDVGIQYLEGNINCSFLYNQVLNNQDTAFKVIGGMANCIISGNNFSGNAGNNFWMTGGFNDSEVTDNTIMGGQNGIRVTVCRESSITRNIVSDCGTDALVFPLAFGAIVTDNTVRNTAGCGIMISGDLIEIESNTVINSTTTGIYIASGDDGLVSKNLVVNSSEYGLKLSSTTSNTSVTENSFIGNVGVVSQVLDEGEDNDISYNHYSNWITPDADSNGIVDVSYSLDGDASNSDPYPIVDAAGTIPVATTGGELPIDLVLIAGVGIAAVVLIVVVFLVKRR
ncbi:MAG: right-handed parallel beta-helix repeat-containing protein [Candidatus Thorarchaeota archaeon]